MEFTLVNFAYLKLKTGIGDDNFERRKCKLIPSTPKFDPKKSLDIIHQYLLLIHYELELRK